MSSRPRLADHALLRRHVTDGQLRYVVHHAGTGALVMLDERAFAISMLADGTRDVDGIALAASRAGVYERASEIDAVLAALAAADLIAHGVEPGPMPARAATYFTTPADEASRATPLEALPGFRFRCDGGGHCCEQYASIALTRDDEARARKAGLKTLPGDERAERVLLPLYGGVRSERMAMTLVDGACLQLDAERGCSLHRAGGPAAKPTACRLYPATFADVGGVVRVSTALECGCVFDSAARDDGAPLVEPSMRVAGDLPGGLTVRTIPDEVRIAGGATAARAALVEWTDALLAQPDEGCAVGRACGLAVALEAHGATARAAAPAALSTAEVAAELAEPLARLSDLTRRARDSADAWRSERDRTHQLRRAIAAAAHATSSRGAEASLQPAAPALAKAESFALRAALFGMHLVEASERADGLASALRDFGARLLVARELSLSGPRSLGHPIAAVMASLRGA